jgi:hypothetical protein
MTSLLVFPFSIANSPRGRDLAIVPLYANFERYGIKKSRG